MNHNNYYPPLLPQYSQALHPQAIPIQSIIAAAPQAVMAPQILNPSFVPYTTNLNSIVSSSVDELPQSNWRQNIAPQSFQTFPSLQQPSVIPPQQLVLSLPPSIPQPNPVIIDNQQYLEFLSLDPNQQPQYIPLQFFLQPQNYLPAISGSQQSNLDTPSGKMAPDLTSSQTPSTLHSQESKSLNHISPSKHFAVMGLDDSPVKSPPKKMRRQTSSPTKR